MVSEEHGTLIKLVMESGLVSHHSLSILFKVLHVLAPPVVMLGEDQWVCKVDLKFVEKIKYIYRNIQVTYLIIIGEDYKEACLYIFGIAHFWQTHLSCLLHLASFLVPD